MRRTIPKLSSILAGAVAASLLTASPILADSEDFKPQRFEKERSVHVNGSPDEVYSLLRAQLGHLLHDSDERFAREEIAPAPAGLPAPGRGRSLRYERRGELLRQRGEVDRVITHDAHYRPVAEALLAT